MSSSEALLDVSNLDVTLHTERATVRASRAVTYSVAAGRTLAIVGESGSGKTILNLAPLGLLPPGVTADITGEVRFDGKLVLGDGVNQIASHRGKDIGVIFQDPLSALNPARRIGSQIMEVAEQHLGMTARAASAHAAELLKMVGIPDPVARLSQYPHELSGGMRQRVVIAAAIAAEPKLLIADEPTTALDVTVQAQIISLLRQLQKRIGMAIVLISHDIGVVAGMADAIAVMYAGAIVEIGSADDVLVQPSHPYTRGLLASVPRLDTPLGAPFRGLPGLPPDLSRPLKGCAFEERCSVALEACGSARPPLQPVAGTHAAACFANVRAALAATR
ncbi:ABC transporter ATP-binding protein [Ancylobacter sp. Lp-2]|uniref:ABC transporter ATP-binding protein n=1 Tax=Ancylobacter sp. Lp-2 TaxID=2881339 RepID=UPI001E56A436|nr:ABC transporter ATP-binding protein [Ancylobacter sp. Lp-2]MCB4771023.1 ABC transporter ATP-binding protein [Ancylobacter sp. Lp-2]